MFLLTVVTVYEETVNKVHHLLVTSKSLVMDQVLIQLGRCVTQ
jgi:hypothetical protein